MVWWKTFLWGQPARFLCLEAGVVPDLAWQRREVQAKVGDRNLRMYFFLWLSRGGRDKTPLVFRTKLTRATSFRLACSVLKSHCHLCRTVNYVPHGCTIVYTLLCSIENRWRRPLPSCPSPHNQRPAYSNGYCESGLLELKLCIALVSLVLLGFNLKDETGQVWWHAWEAKYVLGEDLCEFSSLICTTSSKPVRVTLGNVVPKKWNFRVKSEYTFSLGTEKVVLTSTTCQRGQSRPWYGPGLVHLRL